VAEVLVPVAELVTLADRPTVADVEEAVARTGFSRFPLRAADGRLTGYLHVKDVLDILDPDVEPQVVPPERVRGLPEVAQAYRLDEALAVLRRSRAHLGRVVDGRGETVGLVTLEDLVEHYVGEVRDATHADPSA
jgi:CBS domain containing-hemolysin-like protein